MLGINSATLSRFMSGKTVTITNENLVKIADIFNVSTDYLLGRTDIKDKMNHAASELGLSTEVAQNLYTHRVNPAVVNSEKIEKVFPAHVYFAVRHVLYEVEVIR